MAPMTSPFTAPNFQCETITIINEQQTDVITTNTPKYCKNINEITKEKRIENGKAVLLRFSMNALSCGLCVMNSFTCCLESFDLK